MGNKRTPLGKFIKNTWTSMNIRCGKYKHLQETNEITKSKCKAYQDIKILFTYLEYKNWCSSQEKYILSLQRLSLDRIDSSKDYSLDNIRVIELII